MAQLAKEISNGHKNLSSEINTNISFESGDSDICKDDFLFRFTGQLEYKDEELKSIESSDDNLLSL